MHLARHISKQILLFGILAAAVAAIVLWRRDSQINQVSKPVQTGETVPIVGSSGPAVFDKSRYSANDPASIWVIVNKGRVLPVSYAPSQLVPPNIKLSESSAAENMQLQKEAAAALEKLAAAAAGDNIQLMLVSGYRSYITQQAVYSGYVSNQGQAFADMTSARPGHSEHQTGLAADLGAVNRKCQLDKCFADTAEGKWLAENDSKYGFVIRYPKDKQSLTGYDFEPWHLRYVGLEAAAKISKTGQTLEQFFGLPTYPDYPAQLYELRIGN